MLTRYIFLPNTVEVVTVGNKSVDTVKVVTNHLSVFAEPSVLIGPDILGGEPCTGSLRPARSGHHLTSRAQSPASDLASNWASFSTSSPPLRAALPAWRER